MRLRQENRLFKLKKLITTEDLSIIKVEHVEVSRLFKNSKVDNS